MTPWMKRRIERSRARCHRTVPARKEGAQREESEAKQNRQATTSSYASPHPVKAR